MLRGQGSEFREGRRGQGPPELACPLTVLQPLGTLAGYVPVSCNLTVWFDARRVSILIRGALTGRYRAIGPPTSLSEL